MFCPPIDSDISYIISTKAESSEPLKKRYFLKTHTSGQLCFQQLGKVVCDVPGINLISKILKNDEKSA